MASETFFVDLVQPQSADALRAQIDRITFEDVMDQPFLIGLTKFIEERLLIRFDRDRKPRNEMMPLYDATATLHLDDELRAQESVSNLIATYDATEDVVFAYLNENYDYIIRLIGVQGREYANEFIRHGLNEIAEIGNLG